MPLSNSNLVCYTKLSPCYTKGRTHAIDTITIHCMAGNLKVERCGELFQNITRQCSSNYGIGSDGRIAMYVEEANRSWCSSNKANDMRAVTIEVANDGGAPDWHVSTKAMDSLILLVADICKRNGIKKLVWSWTKSERINHVNGCNMTIHRDYAAKSCPGNYLYLKHQFIADEVNKLLACYIPPEDVPKPVTVPKEPTVTKSEAVYHTVQKGDTLYKIARQYDTTIDKITSYNSIIKQANLIQPGWKIRVK